MNDFKLYDLSKARDQGDIAVGNGVPLDLLEVSRTADGKPDIGAYEYKP